MPLGVKEMSHWFEVDGQLLRARRPPRAKPRKRSSRYPTVDRPFGRDEKVTRVPDLCTGSVLSTRLLRNGTGRRTVPGAASSPRCVQVAISVASPDRIQVAYRHRAGAETSVTLPGAARPREGDLVDGRSGQLRGRPQRNRMAWLGLSDRKCRPASSAQRS